VRGLTAVLAVLLPVPLSTLEAQEPPPIQPGARVRVSQCRTQIVRGEAPKSICERRTGILSSLTPDAVTMWVSDRPTELHSWRHLGHAPRSWDRALDPHRPLGGSPARQVTGKCCAATRRTVRTRVIRQLLAGST
jgi:hypothetical protein